jgi:hypothetical protein
MNFISKLVQIKMKNGDLEIGRLKIIDNDHIIIESLDDKDHLTMLFKIDVSKLELFLDETKIVIGKEPLPPEETNFISPEDISEGNIQTNPEFYINENIKGYSNSSIFFPYERDKNDVNLAGSDPKYKSRITFQSEE